MIANIKKSSVLVYLMKGPIYADIHQQIWHDLLMLKGPVNDYMSEIGLKVFIDEDGGFAFLCQIGENSVSSDEFGDGDTNDTNNGYNNKDSNDNNGNNNKNQYINNEEGQKIPRLINKRALNFSLSLLCALLRKKLAEHDSSTGEPRLILDQVDIYSMMKVFLPKDDNEVKQLKDIDTAINKAIEIGVLRRLKSSTTKDNQPEKLEVRQIIKALINAEWLANFQERIEEYREYGRTTI